MRELTAILIDDETNSRNGLRQKLLEHCPEITIVSECENGEQGIIAIEKLKPDVVFLDVEMPRMNGFVMLKQLQQRNFEIIFTTAYDQYAIQAIRFSALDYLVKPIEVKALKEAVEKVRTLRYAGIPNQRIETLLHNLLDEKRQNNRIAIPSHDAIQFVQLENIVYLKAESNYTSIFLQDATRIFVSKTLKEFEDLLPAAHFFRVHHTYIINKNHMRKYLKGDGGQVLMSNGVTIDVSRRKKEEFIRMLGL